MSSASIPKVAELFAREDAEFVNNALLFFEPQHPVMVNCLDQALEMGRNVQWGDTGPRMLTRVLQQLGCIERAVPPAVCYPIHWSHALEMLRPSQTSALVEQTQSSLFLHLWNEMLRRVGIKKTNIPPKNSLLRGLIEQHQVGGWMGEYDERCVEELVIRYRDGLETTPRATPAFRWNLPMRLNDFLRRSLKSSAA